MYRHPSITVHANPSSAHVWREGRERDKGEREREGGREREMEGGEREREGEREGGREGGREGLISTNKMV